MSVGLLLDSDDLVAQHLFNAYQQPHYKYDRALGIIRDGDLIGTVLLHNWNGHNVEISYYGKSTMTAGIIRFLAQFIVKTFDPARLTGVVNKRNKRYIRSLTRLGFRLEGTQRCYYGKEDCNRNTGVRLVMFRARIDELARSRAEGTQKCS